MRRMRALLLALAMPLLIPVAGNADIEADRARAAFLRGDALPLVEIVGIVERETGGRIVEVEFELEGGDYVYEFELIAPDGRLMEAVVEPGTGRVLSIEEDD